MLHVTARLRADADSRAKGQKINAEHFPATELSTFGMDIHVGVSETSGVLATHPHLVSPDYRNLPAKSGQTLEELRAHAEAPGWQGYTEKALAHEAAFAATFDQWMVRRSRR